VLEHRRVAGHQGRAAKRITCQSGKFQGMIASTVPMGSKATKLEEPSDGAG